MLTVRWFAPMSLGFSGFVASPEVKQSLLYKDGGRSAIVAKGAVGAAASRVGVSCSPTQDQDQLCS